MQRLFSGEAITGFEKQYRTNFINSLPGFRGANLIGTIDQMGKTNLAVFNSVTHIGANPPLMGFIMRPLTDDSRHTYHHIRTTGQFTINHVHDSIIEKAHQTSARYPAEISEFAACGLTPYFTDTLAAPYVAESPIKIGLHLASEISIVINNTILMVGRIIEVILDDEWIAKDGFIHLEKAGSVAVAGLNAYTRPQELIRYAYAKPGKTPEKVGNI